MGNLGTDRTGDPLRFHECHELGEENFLGTHLESKGFAQAQVGHQLGLDDVGVDSAPPPQGSATAAKTSSSNLARIPVVHIADLVSDHRVLPVEWDLDHLHSGYL